MVLCTYKLWSLALCGSSFRVVDGVDCIQTMAFKMNVYCELFGHFAVVK